MVVGVLKFGVLLLSSADGSLLLPPSFEIASMAENTKSLDRMLGLPAALLGVFPYCECEEQHSRTYRALYTP